VYFSDHIIQKVGYILKNKLVLQYEFGSVPETGLNALKMAFLTVAVSEISTFDISFYNFFDTRNHKIGHI